MTYEDAIISEVSFNEARREVEAHGCNMLDFIEEYGQHDIYNGCDVLAWLGY